MIKIGYHDKNLWINGTKHLLDYSVLQAFVAFGNIIVLFDSDSNIRSFGQFKNLICLDESAVVKWVAELPTSNTGDHYGGFLSLYPLRCNSWSCYDCEIDVFSGKITNKIFTK